MRVVNLCYIRGGGKIYSFILIFFFNFAAEF